MDIDVIRNTIKDLVDQSNSIGEENDNVIQSSQFTRPFFESLGWDFNADVKSENFEDSEIKAFQIDSVTRFYLKEFPMTSSFESLTKEIESAVSFAYNKGVTWAVITNFKETRVYNTESTGRTLGAMQHYSFLSSEYIEKFQKLSDLTKKQFSLNVLDDTAEYFGKKPKRVSIDKQLLEDLLAYRNILVGDIVKENSISENDVEFVAQKILNRLIFIRSCGDRQIENRFLIEELRKWEEKKDKKLIYHLQDIFSYFRGRYGSTLFEKHLCDEVIISDKVLQQVIEGTYQSKKKAVRYNFAHIEHDSLGKMYENYLGTIQQKKDGAYYTPSYISKYICQNTIIPYLSKSNVTNIPDLISEYSDNLEELEAKIHDIKVLDPACGTGEFLIRAIDVLLEISTQIQAQKEASGKYTHTVKGKKSGSVSYQTFGKDVENKEIRKIIQNNIHGVDINEEAIEITQLNMFLKLATSSQQLIDLSKNILVGNSLIDDPSVDSAFDWGKEFPEKFDIVIGNPPYVRQEKFKEIKKFLQNKYDIFVSTADLYTYFYEIGIKLLSKNGILGYISSNKFMRAKYGKDLRNFLKYNTCIKKIIDFEDKHLFDAITNTVIIITKKGYEKNNTLLSSNNVKSEQDTSINQDELDELAWTLANENIIKIKEKIEIAGIPLKEFDVEINRGLLTGFNEAFVINEEMKVSFCEEDSESKKIMKPIIKGRDIEKYHHRLTNTWIINSHNGYSINSKTIPPVDVKKNHPIIFKYLEKINKQSNGKLAGRADRGKHWTNLRNCAFLHKFSNEKIIWIELTNENRFAFSNNEEYLLAGAFFMTGKSLKYLIAFLNSPICKFYFKLICNSSGMGTVQWKKFAMERIPIPKLNEKEQNPLIKLVNEILVITKNSEYQQNLNNQILVKELEKKINIIFYKLYKLTDKEIEIIESSK